MSEKLCNSHVERFKHALQGDDPKDYIFIETGSWMGYGIQSALDVGFKKIFSIELSEKYWKICAERFSEYDDVVCLWGDSSKVLPELIKNYDSKMFFYLDAHYDGGDTATSGEGTGFGNGCVLEREFEAIKNHSKDDHILLIDDFRNILNGVMGVSYPKLCSAIKGINEKYDAYVLPKQLNEKLIVPDVLVCRCDLSDDMIGKVFKE
tara:strand:- start:58 stop:678 length:621 start_codon:yes stop_codon:yes gene_type:complete